MTTPRSVPGAVRRSGVVHGNHTPMRLEREHCAAVLSIGAVGAVAQWDFSGSRSRTSDCATGIPGTVRRSGLTPK